ncbi:uncharacterized protein [Paralichthys olivaceus]|uniref:uncharacterized protein n=1 Tax=Paralichthys olivaceus TaxID=8255 RepID=UPI0037507433
MNGPAGAAPPTAVIGGPRHQKAVQESRALVQIHLLTSSVRPQPREGAGNTGSKAPLRLPSLVAAGRGSRRRSSMARLSLSEPSLLTLNENVQIEGFSHIRRPSVLQSGPPPPPPFSKSSALLPCRTWLPPGRSQNQQNRQKGAGCSRPVYIHLSQAIQLSSRPARRHSHNPTPSADTGNLRPLVMQDSSSQSEPLSVVGKPYLPGCGQRLAPAPAAASGPARAQLHVFLPTEAEGEEVDRESVDEGFMDELDCKMTSLKLQQGALKTLTYH